MAAGGHRLIDSGGQQRTPRVESAPGRRPRRVRGLPRQHHRQATVSGLSCTPVPEPTGGDDHTGDREPDKQEEREPDEFDHPYFRPEERESLRRWRAICL